MFRTPALLLAPVLAAATFAATSAWADEPYRFVSPSIMEFRGLPARARPEPAPLAIEAAAPNRPGDEVAATVASGKLMSAEERRLLRYGVAVENKKKIAEAGRDTAAAETVVTTVPITQPPTPAPPAPAPAAKAPTAKPASAAKPAAPSKARVQAAAVPEPARKAAPATPEGSAAQAARQDREERPKVAPRKSKRPEPNPPGLRRYGERVSGEGRSS